MALAGSTVAAAQDASRAVSLEQAIGLALQGHPALARQDGVELAAGARVELARAGLLPQLDVALQASGGTANLVRGATFPSRGVPGLSGPLAPPAIDGAFGTMASLSASWDALGLLARMASVDAALRELDRARAGGDVLRLQLAFDVADAFLGALARAEAVKAARAAEERAAVFETAVRGLVEHDLRPGADLSRVRAERALASTQLIRAQQAQTLAELALAQAVGLAGRLTPLAGQLLEVPPERALPAGRPNPELAEAEQAAAAARAREAVVSAGYLPRLEVVAALWARGSGFPAASGPAPVAAGLVPNVPNWAAGLVASWPALDVFAQRARARGAAAETREATAHRRELELRIGGQLESARAILDGARQVAANTPLALTAAREAEQQATARYRSGLASVTEVAEAQRLLAQAESDDSVARLGVRTAALLFARALGDLEPFLSDLRRGAP